MKKSTIALVAVILILGGYFLYDAQIRPANIKQFWGDDKKTVNQMSLAFLEDLKFKDFDKAATYHHPQDQEKVNIPHLIERLFRIKPEQLDIMDYEVLDTDLDSTGKRARVKLKAKVHLLNTDKIENPEIMLYFHHKDDKWYMELESSLR
jgi:hypothetical protein